LDLCGLVGHAVALLRKKKTPSMYQGVLLMLEYAILHNFQYIVRFQPLDAVSEHNARVQLVWRQKWIQLGTMFHHYSGQFNHFHVKPLLPIAQCLESEHLDTEKSRWCIRNKSTS